MAVTEVGSPTTDWQEGVGSLTISRAVTAGSKGLTVQLAYYNGPGTVGLPTMSWNTTETMTLLCSQSNVWGDYRVGIYFLANPSSGTHNITATFSNTVYYRAVVSEWSNSSSTHGGTQATGTSTTPNVSVASVVSGELTLDVVAMSDTSLTVGAGQSTANGFNGILVTATNIRGGASRDTSSTGSVSMDWTIPTSQDWVIAAAALVEDAGGGGGPTVTWVGYIG